MADASKADEWPEVFRCVCRRGKQAWRDAQGRYACGKCPIEYSPDPEHKIISQKTVNGDLLRVVTHERAWAKAEAETKRIKLRCGPIRGTSMSEDAKRAALRELANVTGHPYRGSVTEEQMKDMLRQGRELHDRLLKAIAAVEKAYR